MESYRHVLFATNLSKKCDIVGKKAKLLAELNSAKISLIHVFTPFHSGYALDIGVVPETFPVVDPSLEECANQELQRQAERLGLKDAECILGIGSPKREIVLVAQERDIDLIVIGGHGLHGLEYILGSTADGVLHRARCDVLTVRMEE